MPKAGVAAMAASQPGGEPGRVLPGGRLRLPQPQLVGDTGGPAEEECRLTIGKKS